MDNAHRLQVYQSCLYNHLTKPGTVTVPGKLSKDLAIGTLKSILRQAQLVEDESTEDEE